MPLKEKKQPQVYIAESLPDAEADNQDPIEEQVKAMYKAIGELSKIEAGIAMFELICDGDI